MENEQEKKYFIIWLYISILLHLLVLIIMLSIKTTTKDPDPASTNLEQTQVIFMQDEPQPDTPKIATRIQGGSVALQQIQTTKQKEPQQDVPTPALSDDYKKALDNQTNVQDQDQQGVVNIIEDAIIDQQEQREKQILQPAQKDSISKQDLQKNQDNRISEALKTPQTQDTQPKAVDILKSVIQEKMQKATDTNLASNQVNKDEPLQQEIQKIVSKKHRPADIGQENLSKVQISKTPHQEPAPKKKISLQDLQSGFSQFVRNGTTVQATPTSTPTALTFGNSLFFSAQGTSDKDDIGGLKLASYMTQAGKMYQSLWIEYKDMVIKIIAKEGFPRQNSRASLVIERSGKISSAIIFQSCGNTTLDNYLIKVIDELNLPPVPKYIPTPLQVTAGLF